MNQKRYAVFYGWWIVAACFLLSLYTGGFIFLGFTAVFEPIANEFGWSYAQISLAASLRGLEAGLLAPFVGLLVDRLGPRRLMFTGAIVSGLGLMLLSRTTSLGMFYGAFAFLAVGMSTLAPTVTMTAVANWFRRKVGIATGIMASGFALGGLLVPLVTVLIDTLGWRTAMLIIGLGTCITGAPLSLLVRHKPEQYGYLPDGEETNTVAFGERVPSAQSAEVTIPAKHAIMRRTFWHIALAAMCQGIIVTAVVTHVMPYLSSIGILRTTSSVVASAAPLISISGRISFGWLGDRLDKRYLAAAGFAMIALSLPFFSYAAAGMWLLVPFLIFFGVGWGGNMTMRAALLREYFGRSKFGTILGFVMGLVILGGIIGAPLAGWVFDNWGSYQPVWLGFAGLATVAVILMATTPPVSTEIRSL